MALECTRHRVSSGLRFVYHREVQSSEESGAAADRTQRSEGEVLLSSLHGVWNLCVVTLVGVIVYDLFLHQSTPLLGCTSTSAIYDSNLSD